ncbi:hypothetical protein EN836_10280 [Mesorhizobium sp. M1C.F.Ca.ET.193.01.1.1]|uniref:hypothetical protein n=1 Tax=unclassified Mesorhizobium TaxID=325217 RepID=UPI000FD54F8A|nr:MULTISPECIES: hypothetical protein [unclassified Mesorhizobium]TGT02166.1 hypothetical protein EN820_26580 [bacterium M00.F.Ca.ET.177.01.1.1]TGQ54418.1 hypothetical protein EN853_10275 [Mesorhizobium sp. M1C.F.Ca.ET.210.01.1.1]TGQ72414.1 hypothetical protein EN855_010285 [Mesorhizobium sp. M1C.F.Ca.ET.212.01.1.1]TGR10210.1 hypothetical protein EN847_10280 [Mesorhizobium sp. M1C.F.Ca.ET.204.01.1.1]TGR30813.1 hypothetical protein EN839_10280 [Mesorhizobium sp. M1C.F.Ca.ET.196.01.1.1]
MTMIMKASVALPIPALIGDADGSVDKARQTRSGHALGHSRAAKLTLHSRAFRRHPVCGMPLRWPELRYIGIAKNEGRRISGAATLIKTSLFGVCQ